MLGLWQICVDHTGGGKSERFPDGVPLGQSAVAVGAGGQTPEPGDWLYFQIDGKIQLLHTSVNIMPGRLRWPSVVHRVLHRGVWQEANEGLQLAASRISSG